MTALAEELRSEISTLSVEERADLAHFLIQSLDEEVDSSLEEAWERELESRRQEILNGDAAGIPAEQVFAELRARHA